MDLPSTVQDFLDRAAKSSVDDLSTILEQLHPYTLPETAIVEAFILWRLQRFSDQLSLLQSFKSELTSYSQYWSLLGLCLGKLDYSHDCVISAFQEALKIDPLRHDIYFNIANYYVASNPALSCQYYQRSIQLNPFFSSSWQNLGIVLRDHFSILDSIKCFRNSLLLSPFDSETYSNLGLCYIANSNFKSAESAF